MNNFDEPFTMKYNEIGRQQTQLSTHIYLLHKMIAMKHWNAINRAIK